MGKYTLAGASKTPSRFLLEFLDEKIRKSWRKIWWNQKKLLTLHSQCPGGGMVDALVSGASAERRAGSSPVLGTIKTASD